jgi:hypothetical protein
MGSILQFDKQRQRPSDSRPERARDDEERFRYPTDDQISEISCSSERRPPRASATRPPRVSWTA